MRVRHMVLAAATVALLLAALVMGGDVRARAGDAASDVPCHAQVNCVGQIANAPLGASMLPATIVMVAAALVVVAKVDLTPSRWRDRLAGGRLFRPPRVTR